MSGYLWAALVMAACTVVGTALLDLLSVTDIAMLYLLGVGVVAAWSSRRQAAFAALLSVALFDFFFVPPRFTFAVSDLHYVVTFDVMLVTALVISWLAERVRADAVATQSRERGAAALSPMSADLLDATSLRDVITVIGRHARAAFGADVRVLLRQAGGRLTAAGAGPETTPEDADREVAQWAFQSWAAAGAGTTHYRQARHLYLPLVGSHGRIGLLELRPDDPVKFGEPAVQWLLQTFAAQVAPALERVLAPTMAPG